MVKITIRNKNKQMKTTTKSNFVPLYDAILASKNLNSTQKIFISIVLRWQATGKICKETNQSLAQKMGMEMQGIKTLIKRMNKLPFFTSISKDSEKIKGGYISRHEITIDRAKLNDYLTAVIVKEPVVKKNKVKEKSIITPSTQKIGLDEDVNLYTLLPSIGFEFDDVNIIIEEMDGSTVTFKDLISCITKFKKEVQYADYEGPSINNNIINNLKQLSK